MQASLGPRGCLLSVIESIRTSHVKFFCIKPLLQYMKHMFDNVWEIVM